jgi:ubiquinone/menaquinone biosynthesis C-methylase UbiE
MEEFVGAARSYAEKPEVVNWLYAKPYDRAPGNGAFFEEIYPLTNLLQSMHLPPGGKILEVGCGPGWVTEILAGLGFEVAALDPSEAMIRIAEERVRLFLAHHHFQEKPRVEFLCQTLEACTLADQSVDAVYFHASLHHVVDEDRGFAQCARVLKDGGAIGVYEAAWEPGNREQERVLAEETAQYGTLENPYTTEYLDWLLARHGFGNVTRYYMANGLYPARLADVPLRNCAQFPVKASNILTARKRSPDGRGTTSADLEEVTAAEIRVLEARPDRGHRRVGVKVELINTGKTIWLRSAIFGHVYLALRQKSGEIWIEASERQRIAKNVAPGKAIIMDVVFELPEGDVTLPWVLDLVSEYCFWFSERGTAEATVNL